VVKIGTDCRHRGLSIRQLVVSYDIDKTMVQSSSVIQGMSFAARNTNFNVLFASSLLFFEIVSI